MNDDVIFNELRDSIWYQLACRCGECGRELNLDDIERLRERDAMAWSQIAAERALESGWHPIPNEIGMLCASCCAKN